MKQWGHLNPSEETGTGCPVTSKYGRTPPNKHGGVGQQQQKSCRHNKHTHTNQKADTNKHSGHNRKLHQGMQSNTTIQGSHRSGKNK